MGHLLNVEYVDDYDYDDNDKCQHQVDLPTRIIWSDYESYGLCDIE